MDELQELVAQNGARNKLELSVDEIIEQHVGSFGFAQLIHVFLVSLAWMFDSQNTLVTVFSDTQPQWICKSSPCSPASRSSMCELSQGAWEWVGSNKTSTIAEWDLICDRKFLAGIPASLFFIGSILGSDVHGRFANKYLGRKKTVLLSCLLTSVTAFITSLAPNVWVYAFLRFCNGFARSGIGICCLLLSTEVVGRNWRGQVVQYTFFLSTVGFLSLPLIAYPARASWRNIYRTIALFPLTYSLFILPFVSESPRWLAIMGKNKEAMGVLNKLAKLNGRKLPSNLSISNPSATKSSNSDKTESPCTARWAVQSMVMVMIIGFGIGFVYYGVQLNVENLNFNVYFTVGANALMEMPAVFVGSVLLSFTDRRVLFSSSAVLGGVSYILCFLFSKKMRESKDSWPQLSLESVGFMAASMACNILHIFCVELFPTNVRNFALSMLRQALMLGAAIAPLVVVLGRLSSSLSFVIFGGFAIVSGVLTLWLPEARNVPLCETLEQQEKAEKLGSGPAAEKELA